MLEDDWKSNRLLWCFTFYPLVICSFLGISTNLDFWLFG
jgi:hypothetical protein